MSNLPQQLTSFIGREREIGEVIRLLNGARLVSLVGTGGCGKTRLSLQVASRLLSRYSGGAWFVELASLSDPKLVPQAVASALGVREEAGRALPDTLADYLKPLKLLLVLDNCEHVLEACASLASTLLQACPHLRVLTTSRERLGIGGEVVWTVPQLSRPDPRRLLPLERLHEYEAVRLFVERARYSQPSFSITPENVRAVIQLCWRLDGLPLAIELAAARTRVLSVEQIVERLDERFRLLISSDYLLEPRQQTLTALMDWSYDLLTEQQQALLRDVSVFAGSFTLDAIKAVHRAEEDEYKLIDLLSRLVEQSLLIKEEQAGAARYRLLDTIRHYALEKLRASGEAPPLRRLHLEYYLDLAEKAQPQLLGENQGAWLDRLETEHDNLRAALEWSARGEDNPEAALRLSAALWRFWDMRGYITEGRRWLDESLGLDGHATAQIRAKALNAAGNLALEQGDYDRATEFYNAALVLRREAGERRGEANSFSNLGVVARSRGEYEQARRLYEDALAIFRELEDLAGVASVRDNLGFVAQSQGDYDDAEEQYREALDLFRRQGDVSGVCIALTNLGEVARYRGEYDQALEFYGEARTLAEELGDKSAIAGLTSNQGSVAYRQGDHAGAIELYLQSLSTFHDLGQKQDIADCLEGLAMAEAQAHPERAVRLFGAAESLRQKIRAPMSPSKCAEYERALEAVRSRLKDRTFKAVWARGRAGTIEETIAFVQQAMQSTAQGNEPVRGGTATSTGEKTQNGIYPAGLTPREVDVLRLLASKQELTNAQIADRLDVSSRTVDSHLNRIYAKIGVSTRRGATRFAIEHGLGEDG